jgi:hypothetical protein
MNAEIIALHDDEISAKACGSIVFWSLNGTVSRSRLVAALDAEGVGFAKAPEEPSATVALHRAVETVSRDVGGEAHTTKRGHWHIVGKPHEQSSATGEQIVYDVRASAQVVKDGGIETAGEGAWKIREAYEAALGVITPQDISGWLCKRLDKLGAVALRESGGFYFVPQDVVPKWEQIKRAVQAASSHKVHGVPALRSKDAVDAILTAIATDTHAECDRIAVDIANPELGRRAIESRERRTAELLDRLARYEALLGVRLDALRDATKSTRAAVATALLGLGSEE